MTIRKLFFEETDHTGIQFFRSLFVGGIATVADMAVLILLRELFHIPENIAAIFGFVVGLAVNYIISTFWVFAKAKVRNRALDFIGFGVIGVIGLGLTQLIIEPFATEGMFGTGFLVRYAVFGPLLPTDKYYIIGKVLAVILVYMWNFFARKFFLYRKAEKQPENPPQEQAPSTEKQASTEASQEQENQTEKQAPDGD